MFVLLIIEYNRWKKIYFFYFDKLTLPIGFLKNRITSDAVKFKPLPLREIEVNFITWSTTFYNRIKTRYGHPRKSIYLGIQDMQVSYLVYLTIFYTSKLICALWSYTHSTKDTPCMLQSYVVELCRFELRIFPLSVLMRSPELWTWSGSCPARSTSHTARWLL